MCQFDANGGIEPWFALLLFRVCNSEVPVVGLYPQ